MPRAWPGCSDTWVRTHRRIRAEGSQAADCKRPGQAGRAWTRRSVWVLVVSTATSSVRTVSGSVVLEVPAGVDVAEQSATTLEARIKGPEWILDGSEVDDVVAHFDLTGARLGWTSLRVTPESLNLPPGISVETVSPHTISGPAGSSPMNPTERCAVTQCRG